MQAASGATVVVVAYRPKPGMDEELLQLTREHVPLLRSQGLATERPFVAARAADGTIVEIFEWVAGAVEKAHSNPVVLKLWERYAAVCEYVPLNQLAESSTMFASFTPIDLD
ncbi:MAG: hypothetical protein PW789_13775 [Edaphobacter sp.]|uniref:hypothetical protein n=1 Tax=Edaphobacter sp. TaxID=1934404 RepID=UPI0023A22FE3|nr:hypothetical protein [Edaphobacter sp.]MDE1177655.1 hypothetical protein [Edaphobacter sp.]